jgi:hypothetical protein
VCVTFTSDDHAYVVHEIIVGVESRLFEAKGKKYQNSNIATIGRGRGRHPSDLEGARRQIIESVPIGTQNGIPTASLAQWMGS